MGPAYLLGVDEKGWEGSLTTQSPKQMSPNPGQLGPRDTAADSPQPTLALSGEEKQPGSF